MSYIEDKNFSSVFGNAADGIEFDSVLEADEENELIEQVLALDGEEDEDPEGSGDDFSSTGKDMNFDGSNQRAVLQIGTDHTDDLDINISVEAELAALESSDNNDDFHETTGENDKSPEDIEEELEGRPDDGDNAHTDTFDIDMSDEAALGIEAALIEAESGIDFAETTGENDKSPEDIKKELEGRSDDARNKHTGTFDPEKGSDLSMGNYSSVEHDLDNMEDAADKAASKGENLYTTGKLSTEAAEDEALEDELDDGDLLEAEAALIEVDCNSGIEEGEDPDPGYDMDNFEGTDDYNGDDDFEGTDDYEGQEDFGGVAESGKNEDPDDDEELIDAADEDDGQMTQAEVEALVAAGGDDELLDDM